MYQIRLIGIAVIAVAWVAAPVIAQPISDYYMTGGSGERIIIASGASFIEIPTPNNGQMPIACRGDIRTYGFNDTGARNGSLYNLDAELQGVNFVNTIADSEFFDATTDGVRIYAINGVTNEVVQFAMDYSNPQVLFTLPGDPLDYLCIAFEPTTNSLWIARLSGGTTVDNFDLNGNLLSQIDVGAGQITTLARDPVDGTLWLADQFGPLGLFRQYDTSGNLLGTFDYKTLGNTFGGEFNIGTPANLRRRTFNKGKRKSGSLRDVNESDGVVMVTKASVARNGSQSLVMDITAKVKTGVNARDFLDILVEGKINDRDGVQKISLFNTTTGRFVRVDGSAIGRTKDTVHVHVNAADFLNGRTVVLRIRQEVSGRPRNRPFKSKFDSIQFRTY